MKYKNTLFSIVCLIAVALLVTSSVLFCPATQAETKEPYKIGATLAITGYAASMGVSSRNAIFMATDEINQRGGINGHKLETVIYDNKSDDATAVLNVRKLIESDQVDAIVGPSTSGSSFATLEISGRLKTPQFPIAAAVKLWRPTRPYSFNTIPGADIQERARARWLNKREYTKVGLLWISGAYSEECLESFIQEAKNFGLTIVANEQYKGTDTDVTVQLNRIMAAKPSAIWVTGYAHQGATVAKNAKSLGIKIPLLGCYAFVTETWIKLSAGTAEGWYGCIVSHQLGELTPSWVPTSPIVKAYAEAYRKRFGEGITNTSGTTYDAVYIIAAGLRNVGVEPDIAKRREKLAHEISNLRNFFGLSGSYNLSPDNHNGIGEWGVSIVKIVNGKMVLQ